MYELQNISFLLGISKIISMNFSRFILSCVLLYKVDVERAFVRLTNYIKSEFRDLDLYTAEGEPLPVPLKKIYVEMEWERCKGVLGVKREPLISYLDVFPMVCT